MEFNESNKFECVFTSVKIKENNSVMFKNFSDSDLEFGLHTAKEDLIFLR